MEERELAFLARGAADESIPLEQLAAWLMADYSGTLAGSNAGPGAGDAGFRREIQSAWPG